LPGDPLSTLRDEFIAFAVQAKVLLFGEFTTKAGRQSPYFFNAGLFNRGALLGQVARFYAKTLIQAEQQRHLKFDMLFGPAYKGITLASATAVAVSDLAPADGGRDMPFAYNRKEAKDHGEGGTLVGARLTGRVVIVDDVISAGTSVRESVELIRGAGATPCAVLIALDRQERGGNASVLSAHSAAEEVEHDYGIPVLSIANLDDIMRFVESTGSAAVRDHGAAIAQYRARYGIGQR
jgi:orotate phosphoribosyltransferase